MTLSDEDIERIVDRLEQRLAMRFGAAMPYDPVWRVDAAMEYVGKTSRTAFHDWVRIRGVNACSRGSYRKSELDRCLSISQLLVTRRARRAR